MRWCPCPTFSRPSQLTSGSCRLFPTRRLHHDHYPGRARGCMPRSIPRPHDGQALHLACHRLRRHNRARAVRLSDAAIPAGHVRRPGVRESRVHSAGPAAPHALRTLSRRWTHRPWGGPLGDYRRDHARSRCHDRANQNTQTGGREMTIGVTIGVEHIGKRVRVIKGYGNFDSAPTGALGVVRAFNPDNLSMVAVELDTRYPSSTTCQGYIPSGRGYWLDATGCLELVDEAPVAKEVAAPSDEEPPPLPTIGPEHIGKRVRVIRQVPGGPPIGTLCVG